MTSLSISPLRLLLFSAGGTAVILGGALAAVVSLWQPRSLDVFLPMDRTIALFSNVTKEDTKIFADHFRTLQTIPDFSGVLDVAVVAITDKQQGWILSAPTKDIPLPSVNFHIGHQGFLLSDATVGAALSAEGPRLRTSTAFLHLTRTLSPTARWIFVQAPAPLVASLPNILEPLMPESGPVLLTFHDNTAELRIFAKSEDRIASISSRLSLLSPPPDLTLALTDPKHMLDLHLQTLPETERIIRQGMLTAKASEFLGGDVSVERDLVPLVSGPSTLYWQSAGSSFLLQSVTSDVQKTTEKLTAFHERFRRQLIGTKMTERTLDKGFTSSLLESDPSEIEDHEIHVNDWIIRETRERSGPRILLTAMHRPNAGSPFGGSEFLIGNSRAWIDQITGVRRDIALPGGPAVLGGALSPVLFTQFTNDVRNQPGWMWLRSFLTAQNQTILWSVRNDGQSLTLSLTLSPL